MKITSLLRTKNNFRRFLTTNNVNKTSLRLYSTKSNETDAGLDVNAKLEAAEKRIAKLEKDFSTNQWQTTFVFTLAVYGITYASLEYFFPLNYDGTSTKNLEDKPPARNSL